MYFTSADTLRGLMAVTVPDNPEGQLLLLLLLLLLQKIFWDTFNTLANYMKSLSKN